MNGEEIKLLIESFSKRADAHLIETHISWVILTNEFAYKFKKPIRYSFLNFEKLERRKYYCTREVELNSRLSNIYLGVIPVYRSGDKIQLSEEGEIVDYGVKMLRMNTNFQMDIMITSGMVDPNHMRTLANKISEFHQNADVIRSEFNSKATCEKFNDICSIKSFLYKELGIEVEEQINYAVLESNHFINSNYRLFKDRMDYGFIRDLHGDLHAKNIFLYKDPIIFDCIEFNDEYRQIDVLNEIAFLCMDLESRDRKDLSDEFMSHYLYHFPALSNKEEETLFAYYKCYRANVRAKVNALKAKQAVSHKEKIHMLNEVSKYLTLMVSYVPYFSGDDSAETFSVHYDHSQFFS